VKKMRRMKKMNNAKITVEGMENKLTMEIERPETIDAWLTAFKAILASQTFTLTLIDECIKDFEDLMD
jgi:hypothetical protein